MSRAASAEKVVVAAPLRPTLVDYVFLLIGCGLSLFFMHVHPLPVESSDRVSAPLLRQGVEVLPALLRLSEGILLMWPVFLLTQRVRGRPAGLTSIEWLWVLSWLGIAVLCGLSAWRTWGTVPEVVQPHVELPRKIWYLILVPSMAVLALLLGLVGLVRRTPPPWTHTFGIVLLLWPVGPLLGIVTLGKIVS
jgi:hypothetical protein